MKFNAVIGNPPYQESKNGNNTQIWPYFIEIATKISNRFTSLIHPGRWAGAPDSMKNTKEMMIKNGLRNFNFYPCSSDVFSNVGIEGGISITNFENETKNGKCLPYSGDIDYTVNDKYFGIYCKNNSEKFVSNEFEKEVYEKIIKSFTNFISIDSKRYVKGSIGIDSKNENKLKENSNGMITPIKVYTNLGSNKGSKGKWYYIEEKFLNSNRDMKLFNNKKVLVSAVGHSDIHNGPQAIISNDIEIANINEVSANQFVFFPKNMNNDYELKLIQSLFNTKTSRFLMTLSQKNFHVTPASFENIPDYTYFQAELEQMGQATDEVRAQNEKQGYRYWFDESDKKWKALFSDKYFYDKFEFSQELIEYIESHISEKKV